MPYLQPYVCSQERCRSITMNSGIHLPGYVEPWCTTRITFVYDSMRLWHILPCAATQCIRYTMFTQYPCTLYYIFLRYSVTYVYS